MRPCCQHRPRSCHRNERTSFKWPDRTCSRPALGRDAWTISTAVSHGLDLLPRSVRMRLRSVLAGVCPAPLDEGTNLPPSSVVPLATQAPQPHPARLPLPADQPRLTPVRRPPQQLTPHTGLATVHWYQWIIVTGMTKS